MSFKDLLKNSVLENYFSTNLSWSLMSKAMISTIVLALFIFVVYYIFMERKFYNIYFNITLVGLAVVTAGVILAMQSNLVISLGMVGALSIVRFRTAIKNPLDLLFLFWSISTGIICGAGLYGLGIVIALCVAALLFLLQLLPIGKSCMLLIVSIEEMQFEEELLNVVRKYCKFAQVKTRNIYADKKESVIVELRVKEQQDLLEELHKMQGVLDVSLVAHDGETTF
ncbi:MAG: DUF4956 domain-containing protein [Lachnospiraceae bacterium]